MRFLTLRFRTEFVGLTLFIALFTCGRGTLKGQAQKKAELDTPSSYCSRDNALVIVRQQIDATKTFDNAVQRIGVLIRAADILWPYQQDKAHAAFSEGFELAQQNYKEVGDMSRKEGAFASSDLPDQRYTVINAIAKRDLAWARKLTDQMLKDQQREAEEKSGTDARTGLSSAEKLLGIATSLLDTDQAAALSFATQSLRYPPTLFLPIFLYKLSAINKAAADALYQEALGVYAEAPMNRFLYLSAYPFGNNREVGEMPGYTVYQVPSDFSPNTNLQRMFVQILLRRVQQFIQTPVESDSSQRVSEPGQMWLALTRLEKKIQQSLPDLAAAAEQARGNIFAQLPQASQRQVTGTTEADNRPKRSFDEQVEAAEKNPNVDRRDQQLVSAVTNASASELLEHVLGAVDKISDSAARTQLLNWLYFERTQRALKDQKLDEARKLAGKVEELDQRAYLYSRIAEESLKQHVDQTQARELLDEVIAAAAKAPATMVTLRALLGVAYLYTKIDLNRAIELIGEAVRRINQMERPDFSQTYVMRKIEGKTFGSYTGFQTPGFSPENVFREIGKIDFDSTLNWASNFTDKSLRAMTTLAVVEQCLKDQAAKPKPKQTKPTQTKP